jgi:hypothetical protein
MFHPTKPGNKVERDHTDPSEAKYLDVGIAKDGLTQRRRYDSTVEIIIIRIFVNVDRLQVWVEFDAADNLRQTTLPVFNPSDIGELEFLALREYGCHDGTCFQGFRGFRGVQRAPSSRCNHDATTEDSR